MKKRICVLSATLIIGCTTMGNPLFSYAEQYKTSVISEIRTDGGSVQEKAFEHISTDYDTYLAEQQVIKIDEVIEVIEPLINKNINAWDYDDEALLLLAKIIDSEASDGLCTDEHKMWVGQVVLNRVLDERFPSTLYEVAYALPKQYSSVWKSKFKNLIPSERSTKAAISLLNGTVVCDKDVVWQAEFKQGKKVVKIFKTKISTTYFCK